MANRSGARWPFILVQSPKCQGFFSSDPPLLPPLGQCLFTRSPSLQRTACDLRIPPLAWSRLIRAAHLLGALRTSGTGTRSRRGLGSLPGLAAASFVRDCLEATRQEGGKEIVIFHLKPSWPIKSHRFEETSISFHELGSFFTVD